MEDINFKKQNEVLAELIEITDNNLKNCGARIRQGKLVSFPTETVYGLGADATNSEAVLSIFTAKGRPLTDPVIVHIATESMIDNILLDSEERSLIKFIGSKLWPGPLTLIGPCNTDYIPALVGSNTGSIGVRWPDNEIAQKLIVAAERPIAAPSANRFMHVSPTKYSHVYYDLYDKDVHILKGEQTKMGVESTVVRVFKNEEGELEAMVLRPGTLEAKDIEQVLKSSESYSSVKLSIKKKNKSVNEGEKSVAPGQLLKHYSPNVDCRLLVKDSEEFRVIEDGMEDLKWEEVALIDFGSENVRFEEKVGLYRDLSGRSDFKEALYNLYLVLRECELKEGIKLILVTYKLDGYEDGEFGATLFDKVYRSASGLMSVVRDEKIFAVGE